MRMSWFSLKFTRRMPRIGSRRLWLAVGGSGAVFALVMMFADVGGNGLNGGVQKGGAESQPGNVFKNVGVFDGLGGRFAPGERGVAGDEDSRNGDRIEIFGT